MTDHRDDPPRVGLRLTPRDRYRCAMELADVKALGRTLADESNSRWKRLPPFWHHRGPSARIMLCGPPGSGKSTLVRAFKSWASRDGWLRMAMPGEILPHLPGLVTGSGFVVGPPPDGRMGLTWNGQLIRSGPPLDLETLDGPHAQGDYLLMCRYSHISYPILIGGAGAQPVRMMADHGYIPVLLHQSEELYAARRRERDEIDSQDGGTKHRQEQHEMRLWETSFERWGLPIVDASGNVTQTIINILGVM